MVVDDEDPLDHRCSLALRLRPDPALPFRTLHSPSPASQPLPPDSPQGPFDPLCPQNANCRLPRKSSSCGPPTALSQERSPLPPPASCSWPAPETTESALGDDAPISWSRMSDIHILYNLQKGRVHWTHYYYMDRDEEAGAPLLQEVRSRFPVFKIPADGGEGPSSPRLPPIQLRL